MNFLAPLFLAGALAVAGPVIFHLIRRTTRNRVRFGSLMFLQPTPPRLTRRSRIDHWVLLLLRALAVALVALAFARPFWRTMASAPPATGAGGRTVLLLDVSASLRREGLWVAALGKARSVIRQAAPDGDLAILAFDRTTRVVLSFDDWRALPPADRLTQALGRLDEVGPTWNGTDLSAALVTAAETLVEGDLSPARHRRQIVMVSDLQEGSRLDSIQSYEWPKGVALTIESVAPTNPSNAGLAVAAEPVGGIVAPEAGVRVRVTNAAGSASEKFQVGWADESGRGFAGSAVDAYVPPGQSRLVTVPWASASPAPGRIWLQGDPEPFDNLVAVAPPPQARVTVLYFGQGDADDPRQALFYLSKALPRTPRLIMEIVVAADPGVVPEVWEKAGFFIITGPISAEATSSLRERMGAGKTVLLALPGAGSGPLLSALAGIGSMLVEDVQPPSYAMLGEIDFRHPVFAPFADPRFSDFTKIRFLKYRRIDAAALPSARVLARFDSGDPAMIEVPVGSGRLVVMTSGWTPDDSQWAVSSKFPPLMASLLEWSGATAETASSFIVGDPIPRAALADVGRWPPVVQRPGGTPVTPEAGATAFTDTSEPGLYTATSEGVARTVPVNLDPAESRTSPLTADDFERLGVPLARPVEPASSSPPNEAASAAETEGRQKLWRWVLLAALAVVCLETLLAGRAARRAPAPTEAHD